MHAAHEPGTATQAHGRRAMIRSELMGGHSHHTAAGTVVHVWHRNGQYIARGSFNRRRFGKTLGADARQAAVNLRDLLQQIDAGTFQTPTEERSRQVRRPTPTKISLRELVERFLAEKRSACGASTAATYTSRLEHVLAFAELGEVVRRWPTAHLIDTGFINRLKQFLLQRQTTRNGRANGRSKPLTSRQVRNVLECLRTALHWAQRARERLLPADFVNPVTVAAIGSTSAKDPLRANPLPLADKLKLVAVMDAWQLTHIGPLLILPLRPEELCGVLVTEVDYTRNCITFGTRMGGDDGTKCDVAFTLPFPKELAPIFAFNAADRPEGPLFRLRTAVEGRRRVPVVLGRADFDERYHAFLAAQKPGTVRAVQDRKRCFRRFLGCLGGVSTDRLAAEFRSVAALAGLNPALKLYDCRHSATQQMQAAGLGLLDLRYLTGHDVSDIMNTYTGLDPFSAMATYAATVQPLLDAISHRAGTLDITSSNLLDSNPIQA